MLATSSNEPTVRQGLGGGGGGEGGCGGASGVGTIGGGGGSGGLGGLGGGTLGGAHGGGGGCPGGGFGGRLGDGDPGRGGSGGDRGGGDGCGADTTWVLITLDTEHRLTCAPFALSTKVGKLAKDARMMAASCSVATVIVTSTRMALPPPACTCTAHDSTVEPDSCRMASFLRLDHATRDVDAVVTLPVASLTVVPST